MNIISMNDVWKNIALSSRLANYKTEDLFDVKISWDKYDIYIDRDIMAIFSDKLDSSARHKKISELSKKSDDPIDQKTYQSVILWILNNDNDLIFQSIQKWVVNALTDFIMP